MTGTASLSPAGRGRARSIFKAAKLALGLVGNFLLGALMTLGIGMYAPCMILVGLLGMNAKAAFPIMMGSCAFLMPISSAQFVQKDAYSLRPALGLGDRRHSRRAPRRAHRERNGRRSTSAGWWSSSC